jgi:hypothetical protein
MPRKSRPTSSISMSRPQKATTKGVVSPPEKRSAGIHVRDQGGSESREDLRGRIVNLLGDFSEQTGANFG